MIIGKRMGYKIGFVLSQKKIRNLSYHQQNTGIYDDDISVLTNKIDQNWIYLKGYDLKGYTFI